MSELPGPGSTLPVQRASEFKPRLTEGFAMCWESVPTRPFQLTLQQLLTSLMSLSRSSWGHSGMGEVGGTVKQVKVHQGVSNSGLRRTDTQPECVCTPHSICIPAHSSCPRLDSSVNKQIIPKQAASVCFLPCAASALCWPNIPLGFAAFPFALLTSH